MFSKLVLISTSLYSISFAQSSPLLTYIGEPKGRHKSILGENFSFEETFKFEFVFGDGSIKMAHPQKKKKKKR